LHLYALSDSN